MIESIHNFIGATFVSFALRITRANSDLKFSETEWRYGCLQKNSFLVVQILQQMRIIMSIKKATLS
jgi:hypothetical protein